VLQVKKAKPGKEAKAQLGVAESKLGAVIQEETGIPCVCNELVGEVLRGVRLHATRFLKGLEQDADLRRSQLGLAHSYSRAKARPRPRPRPRPRRAGASHGRLCWQQAWPAAAANVRSTTTARAQRTATTGFEDVSACYNTEQIECSATQVATRPCTHPYGMPDAEEQSAYHRVLCGARACRARREARGRSGAAGARPPHALDHVEVVGGASGDRGSARAGQV
jgi:hypothetical protein